MKDRLGDFKILGNSIVGPKGQIVIPKEVRDLLGINPGDNLIAVTKGDFGLILIKSKDLAEFIEYVQNHLSLLNNCEINDNE